MCDQEWKEKKVSFKPKGFFFCEDALVAKSRSIPSARQGFVFVSSTEISHSMGEE